MSRFGSCRSVQQEESFILFVCSFSRISGTTLFSGESCNTQFSAHSFSNDRANSQHNTVVHGKYVAATSWLCVLLDNTTVDNVYIHLDTELTSVEDKPTVTDWLNENDELWMKLNVFFHGNGCYAFLFLIG